MRLIVSEDPAIAAAERIAQLIGAAISARGRAVVAFSGGSSPLPMFDHLAAIDLAWSRVRVVGVDERNVDRGHPDSNWAQLSSRLVEPVGAIGLPLTVAPRSSPRVHAMLAQSDTARLTAVLDGRPLDVVHLGLGDDGHTASWPPGVAIPADVAVTAVGPFNGHARITLTPPIVDEARRRVWLVIGASKRGQLDALVNATSTAPAGLVRRNNSDIYCDPTAAPQ